MSLCCYFLPTLLWGTGILRVAGHGYAATMLLARLTGGKHPLPDLAQSGAPNVSGLIDREANAIAPGKRPSAG